MSVKLILAALIAVSEIALAPAAANEAFYYQNDGEILETYVVAAVGDFNGVAVLRTAEGFALAERQEFDVGDHFLAMYDDDGKYQYVVAWAFIDHDGLLRQHAEQNSCYKADVYIDEVFESDGKWLALYVVDETGEGYLMDAQDFEVGDHFRAKMCSNFTPDDPSDDWFVEVLDWYLN